MKFSRALKLAVVIAVGVSLPGVASADTYNFYFSKPKKKAGEAEKPAEPAKPDAVVEAPKPPGATPPPVIINNYNGTPPAKTDAPTGAPATTIKSSVFYGRSTGPSRWRLGLSALYYPRKDVSDFWTSLHDVPDKGYGGAISLGLSVSSRVAFNAYGGTIRTSQTSMTQYAFGIDAEFYPFAAEQSFQNGPVELGLVAGFTTGFFTDHKIGAIHGGARLMLNFTRDFGLTMAGRASFDYLMGEGGILIRL